MSGTVIFLLGAVCGVTVGYLFLRRARREAGLQAEAQLRVRQEKQIVVDFVHDMVEALGENLGRDELLQRIVHAAILSTGALSACFFERTGRDRLRGAAVEGLFPPHRPLPEGMRQRATTRARFLEQILRSEEFAVGDGIVGEVAQTRRAVLVADARADKRIIRHDDPALVVQSLIATPVVFGEEFFGVLCVVNPTDGLAFGDNDLALVQSLAEQAGMAIHNQNMLQFQLQKRQLDVDLALASSVQQMLLPRESPAVPGLEIDARYRAAQHVGGDLYDFVALPGGRLGVAVADVSGKGIAASLLMAICRTNLRQVAPRHTSPAATLTELNWVMSGEMQRGMYITMLYAVVDPAKGEIVLARAGHERPLFLRGPRAGGTERGEYLESEGMPLGLVPADLFEGAIEERRITLGVGDLLVLYTDGITEAPNESGQEFSGARLADVVRNLGTQPVKAINDSVLEAVQRFSGRDTYSDDLTLVTIKRVE